MPPANENNSFADWPGAFASRACPGSGKTFAVASRLANKLESWQLRYQGVAALSFTNVAKDEISRVAQREFGVAMPVEYPHFIGTIDSFIDRFVFLPFGHLAMGIVQRPKLVGPPHDDWEPIGGHGFYWRNTECNRAQCKLNDFSYDIHGNLVNIDSRSHFSNCQCNHSACRTQKRVFTNRGFATQTDANYFAMQVLEQYPDIRNALAYRFPSIILDEAQDTSDIQMRILDLIKEGGCRDMAMVGDPDQAIYEWRNASPRVFSAKCVECAPNAPKLTDNRRSSQNICDFFAKISSLETPPNAVNPEHRAYPFVPQIWEREENNPQAVISKFIDLCREHGIIAPSDIAILTRGRELSANLAGTTTNRALPDPWKDRESKNLAGGKYLFDKSKFAEGFHLIERTVFRIENNGQVEDAVTMRRAIAEDGIVRWRLRIAALLAGLPNASGQNNLRDWVIAANEFLLTLLPETRLTMKRDRRPNYYSTLTFDDVFGTKANIQSERYILGTIHSVKGETFMAVLLIIKHTGGRGQIYETILNDDISENEELRNIYVAITRPRRLLVIAVPPRDIDVWKSRFEAL